MDAKEMDEFTIKRWAALIDGVNLIYNNAEKCGVKESRVVLKQGHLVKYIDEVTEKVRLT